MLIWFSDPVSVPTTLFQSRLCMSSSGPCWDLTLIMGRGDMRNSGSEYQGEPALLCETPHPAALIFFFAQGESYSLRWDEEVTLKDALKISNFCLIIWVVYLWFWICPCHLVWSLGPSEISNWLIVCIVTIATIGPNAIALDLVLPCFLLALKPMSHEWHFK